MNPFIDDLHRLAMTQNQLRFQILLYEVNKIAKDLGNKMLRIPEQSSRKQSHTVRLKPSAFIS